MKLNKTEIGKEIVSWVKTILLALILAAGINTFIIVNAEVPSGSMENTIMTGDRLIGNRLAYIRKAPQRGDIVIFKYPDDESQKFVKRVIGLPGETVEIIDAKIYIEGSRVPLEEDYLKDEWTAAAGPYYFEVPEDSYLVLGDNRNHSVDARVWQNQYVARDKILGKAVFRYYPFKEAGSLYKD